MSRKHDDQDLDFLLDKCFAAADASEDKDVIVEFLKAIKLQWQSASTTKPHKPAKSFTLEDALDYFSLTYTSKYSDSIHFRWNIEKMSEVKEMQPSPCLSSSLTDYTANYDRSSEAACRVALDLIIAYCLAELKGRDDVPPILPITPKLKASIKAFREISFTYSINDTPNSQGVIVGGRVDHGIGIVFKQPMTKPYRRFHSLLLCVEAKIKDCVGSAYGQLVTYLASLHESRINRGKTDSSVYGLATDGLKYVFVTITNEGVLLFSTQFDVMCGDLPVILGCLRYILEKAIATRTGGVLQNDKMDVDANDADEELDIDDSPYIMIEGDGDDESDDD